jgi:hypothetical protein
VLRKKGAGNRDERFLRHTCPPVQLLLGTDQLGVAHIQHVHLIQVAVLAEFIYCYGAASQAGRFEATHFIKLQTLKIKTDCN